MARPLILLTNDDGYHSPGLRTLFSALHAVGETIICAPRSEQSAASHALTLHRPMVLREHEKGVFSVDGTPADSVYTALFSEGRVLPRTPDVVVSGINLGLNLGDDVFYSGTVAAAREAALRGVSAMAVSASKETDLEVAASYIASMLQRLLASPKAAPLLLNVNFPPGKSWETRVTTLGRREYAEGLDFRIDPRGREYFWLGRPGVRHPPMVGADTEAFDQGVAGITPLSLNLTSTADHARVEHLLRG